MSSFVGLVILPQIFLSLIIAPPCVVNCRAFTSEKYQCQVQANNAVKISTALFLIIKIPRIRRDIFIFEMRIIAMSHPFIITHTERHYWLQICGDWSPRSIEVTRQGRMLWLMSQCRLQLCRTSTTCRSTTAALVWEIIIELFNKEIEGHKRKDMHINYCCIVWEIISELLSKENENHERLDVCNKSLEKGPMAGRVATR